MSYQGPGTPGQPDPWGNEGYSAPGAPDHSAPPNPGQPGSGPPAYDQTGYSPSGPPDPGHPVSGQPVSGEPSYGGYEPAAMPPPATGYGQQQYGQQQYGGQAGYGAQPGYGAVQPYAHGQYVPRPDERQTAMLTQLLALFFGWIGALVMYVVKKDESGFVKHHAVQALNLSISVGIIAVGGIIVSFATCGFGAFVAVPVMLVWWIAAIVYHILAAMAANRGEWYVFPTWVSWPMIK